MAETSRSRVTITLGRSGQVVKRAADVSDVGFSDSMRAVGKRSIRDRLGSNVDSSALHGSQFNKKRQRRDSMDSNGLDDLHIGKDDLRYKLMRKNVFRRADSKDEHEVADLREKLSRTVRPPSSSLETRQRMPEPMDSNILSRTLRPSSSSLDTRQCMPESTDISILSRIPSIRCADDMSQMDPLRNSYPGWTLDHIRRRSPDGILGTSRGLSPQRKVEVLQKRPVIRSYDDVRSVPYMGKDIMDPSRPVSTGAFMPKPTFPTGSAKPAAPLLAQVAPPSGIRQGDEQPTVDGLLHSLGLGKYAIHFKAEEVDMTALKQMGDNDLKELGIPMGPRKKILLALLPRSKRQL